MKGLNITVKEVKELLENRLGRNLAEIIEVVKEVNLEILNNSETIYFEVITNNNPFPEFIFSEETSVIKSYIKLVCFNVGVNYCFIDSNTDKIKVLKWMTDLLISSNLVI